MRKNLRRAEKLLRNMSVVAEIQSAIAMIRKHAAATPPALEQFVARPGRPERHQPGHAAGPAISAATPPARSSTRWPAPTTSFPPPGIDAGRYVTVLQAELRAIASRLVMPEFMLTSDACNANYSFDDGGRRAGGEDVRPPAARHDRGRPGADVARGASRGRGRAVCRPKRLALVDIRGIPPTLAVRDRLKDAQADQILVRNGAMSVADDGHAPRARSGAGGTSHSPVLKPHGVREVS